MIISLSNDENNYHLNSKFDSTIKMFLNRVVQNWNKLSGHVAKSGSINSFKNSLDKFYDENLILIKEYRQLLRNFTQNNYIIPEFPFH